MRERKRTSKDERPMENKSRNKCKMRENKDKKAALRLR
jgi:hypothetical protein